MKKSYTLEDILEIWGKDEEGIHEFEEKGYKSWKERRVDKMNKHGVDVNEWYRKVIKPKDVLDFRVGTFPAILKFFVDYLEGNPENYLKIKETKIKYFESIYSRNEEKINSIMDNIPEEINFIAWERNGEYILTEGHHRAIAIARLLNKGIKIDNIKLNLYYHPVTSKELIKNIDFI